MAGFASPGVLNPIDPQTGYSRNYPGSTILLPFLVKPNISDFTWLNQSTTTVVDNVDRITVTAPDSNATQCHVMVQPLVTTPYTITLIGQMLGAGTSTSGLMFGLAIASSGNAIRNLMAMQPLSGLAPKMRVDSWTSATAFSAIVQDTTGVPTNAGFIAFRITDDGTTRTWRASQNGKTWATVRSENTNTGVTPTQAGMLFYNNNGGSASAIASAKFDVFHWQITGAILGDAP
jgi:hypothetical protein